MNKGHVLIEVVFKKYYLTKLFATHYLQNHHIMYKCLQRANVQCVFIVFITQILILSQALPCMRENNSQTHLQA